MTAKSAAASASAARKSVASGSAATLRRHFQRAVGVSPTAYRATFRVA
ncbi:hypothetical protein H1W00_08450 [Aeromicrobium sp. Marseille-Q0843]|uniref:AraC family transcriptional regulator n=1 Tax=Aeromicrobium phoceense TaxID=2754045 RepID=A0A838XNE0_9ACTN|nr:hypothetical protein [Aeromicrobium phoceense]MBA4608504.1 hypothetical protein [Aeromicrobium phoceense]